VRITYPHLGMGIAFIEMTTESQLQLKQLLTAIWRPSSIMGAPVVTPRPIVSPLGRVPAVSNPAAAVTALIRYFEGRHILTREDFLDVLRKSQPTPVRSLALPEERLRPR
jgi:hypothetical protein